MQALYQLSAVSILKAISFQHSDITAGAAFGLF
jgi:hypothetical protein